ncbi:MAG: hypothetical protein LBS59_04655 [Puniceicoccales bacterium]|jgi:hypothetical protein|nr:hypothetical protein [Puniceicoccales bacterium]
MFRFSRPLCIAFAFLTATAVPGFFSGVNAAPSDTKADLYVSPDGKDDAAGTRDNPCSISAAQRRIGEKTAVQRVVLLGGNYYFYRTLEFSGDNAHAVKWEADAAGAPVVFSGGRPLRLRWEASPDRPGVFQATVPANVSPFDQLFVNDRLQVLARFPNYDPKARYLNGTSADATSRKRVAQWKNPKGGFVHALHRGHWGDMHYEITGKSADGDLQLQGGWGNNRPEYGPHKDIRFVEGVFEELDAPGEWFFDAAAKTLYFFPPKDVDLATASVVVPQLETIVRLEGTKERRVRGISLIGIVFKHSLRTFIKKREPLQRSDWCVYRGGAVFFKNTEDCAIINATFDTLGGNAVFVNNRNSRVSIYGSYFHDIGANGVAFVGDPAAARSPLFHYSKTQRFEEMDKALGPKGDNFPADCHVEECLFTRIGRIEKQSAAIDIDLSQRIRVTHCTVANVPRAGINIGSGTWGGHRIEHSDVFDTVRETGDHGSFNSWGRDRFWYPDGNKTTNRLVAKDPTLPFWDAIEPTSLHHNRWRCDHGWDIDLDDGSSNYIITNNLCLGGGIKLREGYRRTVENNVTINNGFHPHAWFVNSDDIVRKNIFFLSYMPRGGMQIPKWGKELDYNFLHVPKAREVTPAKELQKHSKQDKHSIAADALFRAPKKGDFRVTDDSPALKIGFNNFSMNDFGVTLPHLRALAPRVKFPTVKGVVSPAVSVTNEDFHGAKVRSITNLTDRSAAGLMEDKGVLVVANATQSTLLSNYGVQDNDVILAWGTTAITDLASLRAAAKKTPAPASIDIWRTQHPQKLRAKTPPRP